MRRLVPPGRRRGALAVLAALVVLAGLVELASGSVAIGPGQALAIVAAQFGISTPWSFEPTQAAVLLAIRGPRMVTAIVVGAGLAVAGAAMQGLFRNPLADPGLLGVTSGAAVGVAAALLGVVPGLQLLSAGAAAPLAQATLPLAAFVGGVLATALVVRLAQVRGRSSVAGMLLAGIAVNALAGAGLGLAGYLADDAQLRNLSLWLLGSLGATTWTSLAIATPIIGGAVVLLMRRADELNVLQLGEAEALQLGVAVDRLQRRIVALVALAVGAAVAFTGAIGFVGLVVPHVARVLFGPDHRLVLPAVLLLGPALLLLADALARTIAAPAELPIGIVTALIGAPIFLGLLARQRARELA